MRFQDWPSRLDAFTRDAAAKEFAWGSWDCGLAAARCVEALTGADACSEYYREYDTAFGAARTLKEVAGGGLMEGFTRLLGEPLPSPKMAQRGDICLFDTPDGDAVGWCIGPNVAAVAPSGLTFVPISKVKVSWRVE